jgi:hypothetical protein
MVLYRDGNEMRNAEGLGRGVHVMSRANTSKASASGGTPAGTGRMPVLPFASPDGFGTTIAFLEKSIDFVKLWNIFCEKVVVCSGFQSPLLRFPFLKSSLPVNHFALIFFPPLPHLEL